MDTTQKLCTLLNVKKFLGFYPSDLLPFSLTQSDTLIVNRFSHGKVFALVGH